ncbi:signal transduction histidine kinase, nitrate/nitrite-specific [Thioflavicoccus mobilis 8321]|uniref:Sensor protein n=1 Tax=Thioflavicoccus mobilis 8321 TaxID=765912 RepID=L0GWE4_9GAMM|nr:ATP-binding protein [Thioflavicoccus mobilis]AGA91073.1 signal transduction histidine kinase, nitrate/nitrite-specific [Thioflavicoccus mobilis 8321]
MTAHPYRPPRTIDGVWPLLGTAGLVGPSVVLVTALLAAVIALMLDWLTKTQLDPIRNCLPFLAVALIAVVIIAQRLHRQVLRPLVELNQSVARVCQGEPGASRGLENMAALSGLADDIASLNEELTELYEEMDSRVARQTQRLAQKTASLKILYDVAATINQADDLEDLLLRFLRVLKQMINGCAATVRVTMLDGHQHLVGAIGLDDKLVRDQDMAPVDLCLCGTALSPGDILCDNEARFCATLYGRQMFTSEEVEAVTVPLDYHDEQLGLYTIFIEKPGIEAREDIQDLLATVGHHLGVAVAKYRSDAETQRLSIVEERNSLAHELHDSLAQTLASLRFQCRLLADSLADSAIPTEAHSDLARIRNGLDEANTELRELLASFRAPLDRRGLVPGLTKLTERFGQETGIHVFFQDNCRPFELTATEELQILRIVQEALANIRKHAKALTVRVLLTREASGTYVILVEDDGIGFNAPRLAARPGEQIGLSIMEERARRIGAELRIESEPGEGTRVELFFVAQRRTRPAAEAA